MEIQEAIGNVINSLLGLIVVVLGLLIPVVHASFQVWTAKKKADILKNHPDSIYTALLNAAEIGAKMAQQLWETNKIAAHERMEMALDAALTHLNTLGYTNVDLDPIEAMIESLIFDGVTRRGEDSNENPLAIVGNEVTIVESPKEENLG